MTRLNLRQFAFHPLLLGLYPVAALLAANLDQVRPSAALRVGLLSVLGSLLIYGLLRLALRDAGRAAVLASFWLVLVFSYGHVYQTIEGHALAGFVYGKHRYLMLVWLALFAAGSWWALRRLASTAGLIRILNLVSLFLLAFPLFQITTFEVRYRQLTTQPQTVQVAGSDAASAGPGAAEVSPDIYYIVLDGYSRADIMQDLYDLDIGPFMRELEDLGFVFPRCTQSNYGITAFSIFATLNMNYLDAYEGVFPLGSDLDKVDYLAVRDYLRHSQVRQFLSQRGYQMVTFETGYWWLDIDDAELYIVANNNPLIQYSQSYALSNFEDLFLRTTALRVLSEANTAFLSPFTRQIRTSREHHYDVVRFALDQLDKVPEIPGQKFVYFHILAPHDPFVFDPDGNYVAAERPDMPGYSEEVMYLNKRLVEIVRSLIAGSDRPPVIILQGDHGWDPRYRMEILNAYYLPPDVNRLIYSEITPVNTFRVILDHYFDQNYGLLPDASYFSFGGYAPPEYGILARPYQLQRVPGSCLPDQFP